MRASHWNASSVASVQTFSRVFAESKRPSPPRESHPRVELEHKFPIFEFDWRVEKSNGSNGSLQFFVTFNQNWIKRFVVYAKSSTIEYVIDKHQIYRISSRIFEFYISQWTITYTFFIIFNIYILRKNKSGSKYLKNYFQKRISPI